MENLKIIISEPTHPVAETITKEDVWGKWTEARWKNGGQGKPIPSIKEDEWIPAVKVHSGMVVAITDEVCPIWKDTLEFKDATIVCPTELCEEVAYWIEFVKGADSITKVKKLKDGKTAFRCEYTCW